MQSLPRRDRVMLVRADALATPATAFESEPQRRWRRDPAIAARRIGVESGAGARIRAAGAEAAIAARGRDRIRGRGTRSEDEAASVCASPEPACADSEFRRRKMSGCARSACGGRRRRPIPGTFSWRLRNYGITPARPWIWACSSAKSPAGSRRLDAAAGRRGTGDVHITSPRRRVSGSRINVRDAFPQDDRAVIELPRSKLLRMSWFIRPSRSCCGRCLPRIHKWTRRSNRPTKYDPDAKGA